MVKILVTGSDSRFGKLLKKLETKYKFIFRNKKELNIEGEARIRYFKSINCNISFVKENYNLETLIKKINELLPKNIENIKKNFN